MSQLYLDSCRHINVDKKLFNLKARTAGANFHRCELQFLQIVFYPTFNPRPRLLKWSPTKVTGRGYGQGFQVANEETGGGETLRRLAICLLLASVGVSESLLKSPANSFATQDHRTSRQTLAWP